MKSFGHPDAKMQGLENLSLWLRLNFFAFLILVQNIKKNTNFQRWNLKNLSRGLNPSKPGLNSAPA